LASKNIFLSHTTNTHTIELQEGDQATVYDLLNVSSPMLDQRQTTIKVASQASLFLLCQQDVRSEGYGSNSYKIEINDNAKATIFLFFEGSPEGSFSFELVLKGKGAQVEVYGVYCLASKNKLNLSIHQQHNAPNTTSNVVVKGALFDEARADFSGKIAIAPLAHSSHAELYNKNLLFSDLVRIKSKPELEVLADAVQCKHGSALGNIDEEHLFYMQSRGFSEDAAKHFLLSAFLGEVLEKVPDQKMQKTWLQKAGLIQSNKVV
jgi:Fe-S cluster assembly protein SufD